MESGEASSCNNGMKLLDAAMEGRADDAVKLLTIDPDLIHFADPTGDTAFHVAARAGHGLTVSSMIECLLWGYADTLIEALCEGNVHGDTPLHLALKNDQKDIAVNLAVFERDAILIENYNQESSFDLADQAGIDLLSEIKHLEEKGQGRRGFTLQAGKVDLEMRLTSGVNCDEEKWLKLYEAAEAGKEDVVMEILKNDPKMLERKKPSGETALHAAACSGNIELLQKMVGLIESKQDQKRLLLEVDRDGLTPLHLALIRGHEKVARYLVEVAPRAIFKRSRSGLWPLCQAIDKGYSDLVRCMTRTELSQAIRKRLRQHAKLLSLAHFAIEKRNLAVLQAILEGLPEVINYPDRKGWKVISYAAWKGYFEEFRYILKSFPDSIRNIDEDGSYPIHKVVAGGHVKIVKEFLLHCPQALQDIDEKGRNLIEIATKYESKDVLSYLKGKEE